MSCIVWGGGCQRRTNLEPEILLQLAELFNLSLDLSLAPILYQLLLSKCYLLSLSLVLSIRFGRFG